MSRLRLGDVVLHECGTCDRRNTSTSVSWNSTGSILASSSPTGAKLWSSDSLNTSGHASLREQSNLSHTAHVDRVRFHPSDASLLCTSSEDKSVQLWDIRSSRSLARIPLQTYGKSVEWQTNGNSNLLVITERDNSVHVHDVRRLKNQSANVSAGSSNSQNSNANSSQVKMFQFQDIVADTHFSPSGTHLISAAKRMNDGMGVIHLYPLETPSTKPIENSDNIINGKGKHSSETFEKITTVGHTGNIFAMKFSPDGKKLATGGNDALVGLWNVQSLTCTATISRRTKFIRSVAFSFDSKIVACCSQEKNIDIADASTGELVGELSLAKTNERDRDIRNSRGGGKAGFGTTVGADEIAFHPKAHLIACARGESITGPVPQVTIAKLHYTRS